MDNHLSTYAVKESGAKLKNQSVMKKATMNCFILQSTVSLNNFAGSMLMIVIVLEMVHALIFIN